MIYDDDADLQLLDGKTVAIIGYGSQGHAHALNLKDSGVDVIVGLRADSASVAQAREQGLEVLPVVEASSRADLVMMLVPDELHRQVWENEVRDGVGEGNALLFGHGFSIHYGEVTPPPGIDVAMVAPKGPGHLVRRQFLEVVTGAKRRAVRGQDYRPHRALVRDRGERIAERFQRRFGQAVAGLGPVQREDGNAGMILAQQDQ